MEEILKKLLESELLSEDVKVELKTQWQESVTALKESFREEALLEVRSELSEQWVEERDALIESLEKFTGEKLDAEIAELKEDIERFRDLEAEFAGKLVEEKQVLANKLAEELDALTNHIDDFFEVRLAEEFSELQEDIRLVRENDFGRRMFESFVGEFNKSFVDEASVQRKLSIAEDKLKDANRLAAKLEESVASMTRDKKMEDVLSNLSGSKREQMSFILSNVETKKLDEAYKMFIGRVLKEEAQTADTQVTLTESKKAATTLVTGDAQAATSAKLNENKKTPELLRAMSLAGIKS